MKRSLPPLRRLIPAVFLLALSFVAAPRPASAEGAAPPSPTVTGPPSSPPASPPASPPSDAPSEKWESVSGSMIVPPGESIPASTLVGVAYGIIWLLVAAFVTSVWWRQAQLTADIDELKRTIAAAERARNPRG